MRTFIAGKRGVVALLAGAFALTTVGACDAEIKPAPEASVIESSQPENAPEAKENAKTAGVEKHVLALCKTVEPSLTFWRTNSVRGARVSFNSALAEWALRNNVSVRSLVKHPRDVDIAMAKKCPEIWKETKLALATDNLSEVVIHL